MNNISNKLSASCSSFTSPSSSMRDVFLSFNGNDTRRNFTSHLYFALNQAGISTFMDDHELQKGEEISSGRCNAIKNSKKFVVVLSENYVHSLWCRDELVEILRCKRSKNHVGPVLYYVNPSNIRYVKGTFGEALDFCKKSYSDDMIEKLDICSC